MGIDMLQFVKALPSRPRGRACIVLTHDYEGQKEWAEKLARHTNSDYLNLLNLFTEDTSLADNIGQFLVPTAFEFFKNRSQSPVLIVSDIEFLKATWAHQSDVMDQFATRVETWNHNPCLVFVIQFDRSISTREYRRFPQYSFVIDQKETLAL